MLCFLFIGIFKFENHEAQFPIAIKQPQVPVLYDMGTGKSEHNLVTSQSFIHLFSGLNWKLHFFITTFNNFNLLLRYQLSSHHHHKNIPSLQQSECVN